MPRSSFFAVSAALIISQCGCMMISRSCHRLGDILSPAAKCELCGGAPCVCPPVDPFLGIPGNASAPVAPDALQSLRAQVDQLSEQCQLTRTEMDQMRLELQGRSQELIGTRAQLAAMENQVGQLSQQMNHWSGQLAQLQSTLRENDQQRTAMVQRLTQSVAHLADQNENTTSELVMEAMQR